MITRGEIRITNKGVMMIEGEIPRSIEPLRMTKEGKMTKRIKTNEKINEKGVRKDNLKMVSFGNRKNH
jgi:DNA-binding CsgD family transcriptional regulator